MMKHPAPKNSTENEPPDKKRKLDEDLWSDDDDENDLLMSQINLDDLEMNNMAGSSVQTISSAKPTNLFVHNAVTPSNPVTNNKNIVLPMPGLHSKPSKPLGGSFAFPESSPWMSGSGKQGKSQAAQQPPLHQANQIGVTRVNLSSKNRTTAKPNQTNQMLAVNSSSTAKDQCDGDSYAVRLKDLKSKIYTHEGESKILRKTMTEKENEVVQLKQDLSRQLAQHRQQQQDQEKEMKKLQDNYETQLQFKDNELKELQNNLKRMEKGTNRSANVQLSQTFSQRTVEPVLPVQRQPVKSSTRSKEFLNKFDTSPVSKAKHKMKQDKVCKQMRRLKSGTQHTKAQPQINHYSYDEQNTTLSATPVLRGVFGLTPWSEPIDIRSTNQEAAKQKIGDPQEYTLSGLMKLLHTSYTHKQLTCCNVMSKQVTKKSPKLKTQEPADSVMGSVADKTLVSPINYNLSLNAVPCLINSSGSTDDHNYICLLPLFDDYLTAYLALLQNSMSYSQTISSKNVSPSSATHSTSADTSNDSTATFITAMSNETFLTYSYNLLLLTRNTLIALKLLLKSYPKLCDALVGEIVIAENKDNLKSQSAWVPMVVQITKSTQILQKLIQLSNVTPQMGNVADLEIVFSSLQILKEVAKNCEKTKLDKFEQLLSQEILLNCFDSEFESILHKYCPDCYIEAIELCTALMRSQYMLNLMCGLRDDCLLLLIYNTCSEYSVEFTPFQKVLITHNLIKLMMAVFDHHKSGAVNFLQTTCLCKVDVIRPLVSGLIHTLFLCTSTLNESNTSELHTLCRTTILEGVHALYTFHTLSKEFILQNCAQDMEYDYAHLICNLHTYIKQKYRHRHDEVVLIKEIWSFVQNFHDDPSD